MTRYQFLVDINYKVVIEGSKLKNMKGKFFWLFNCEMTLSLKPSCLNCLQFLNSLTAQLKNFSMHFLKFSILYKLLLEDNI